MTRASPRRSSRRSTPGSPSATRSPAAARVTGVSCTCTERTRTSLPPGATLQDVALRDRARPERAGHHRADPAEGERRGRRKGAQRGRSDLSRDDPGRSTQEGCSELARAPRPSSRSPATTSAPGTSSRGFLDRDLERLVVDESPALVSGDDSGLDPEQAQGSRGARSSAGARPPPRPITEQEKVYTASLRRPSRARNARARGRRSARASGRRRARGARSRGRSRFPAVASADDQCPSPSTPARD